jgi:hypothetical protein
MVPANAKLCRARAIFYSTNERWHFLLRFLSQEPSTDFANQRAEQLISCQRFPPALPGQFESQDQRLCKKKSKLTNYCILKNKSTFLPKTITLSKASGKMMW